jgi:hypothetical protein
VRSLLEASTATTTSSAKLLPTRNSFSMYSAEFFVAIHNESFTYASQRHLDPANNDDS